MLLLTYEAGKHKVRRQLIETEETNQWSGVGLKIFYCLKGINVNRKSFFFFYSIVELMEVFYWLS